ncbi:sensor histidine kinase [Streptosporangium sp. CA-115845]|uniref:sensor histidine kinase n=1 Tax=Streptosporangium sp. CA-115845 TaxID=3240071 RepID=UPI003D9398A3
MRRVVSRFPRLPLLAGLVSTAGAAAAVLAGPWPVAAGIAGFVGGTGLAVAGVRGMLAAQQAELDRLGELVDRRAEQVTSLSHELRTPLSMIKGAVDLLVERTPGPLTTAQERFLTVVDRQCAHVIALCESLLIQAKIEAGLFTPRLERVDMSVIARDVVTAMRALCAERRQRITLDTPQVTPDIAADPLLLTQALTNLLSNASRFTSVGGSIDVRVAVIDTETYIGIAVYVTDDGAGMTREQRRRLFHRFATGRPLADGTGLGLAITKTIIELHGGSIMVDTTSMHGTTFLLTLPG